MPEPTAAEVWLRSRVSSAPPGLLETMIGALPADPGLEVPDALASAAMDLYARVLEGSGGREDALPLLAADALFTHAFQAQSELDHAGLRAFAERWDGRGALTRLARS